MEKFKPIGQKLPPEFKITVFKEVLEKAVFGPLGIYFEMKIKNYGSTFRLDEFIEIKVFIDLEKFMPIGNNYNQNYENNLYSIEDTIEYGLALVGLVQDEAQVYYEYVNYNSIDKLLIKMTKELQDILSNTFDVPLNELQEIQYYLYVAESESPYIRVDCDFYELPDSIDTNDAEDIAKEIFYSQKKLSDLYDMEVLL